MTYHNQKEFVCPHCGKDFPKKRQLKSHIKDTHDKKEKGNDDRFKK